MRTKPLPSIWKFRSLRFNVFTSFTQKKKKKRSKFRTFSVKTWVSRFNSRKIRQLTNDNCIPLHVLHGFAGLFVHTQHSTHCTVGVTAFTSPRQRLSCLHAKHKTVVVMHVKLLLFYLVRTGQKRRLAYEIKRAHSRRGRHSTAPAPPPLLPRTLYHSKNTIWMHTQTHTRPNTRINNNNNNNTCVCVCVPRSRSRDFRQTTLRYSREYNYYYLPGLLSDDADRPSCVSQHHRSSSRYGTTRRHAECGEKTRVYIIWAFLVHWFSEARNESNARHSESGDQVHDDRDAK